MPLYDAWIAAVVFTNWLRRWSQRGSPIENAEKLHQIVSTFGMQPGIAVKIPES